MKVDITEIQYIARLARLHLSENEASIVSEKLGIVLDYMSKLEAINSDDVNNVKVNGDLDNVFREDIKEQRISLEQAMSQAPDTARTYFKVPKVIT